MQTDSPVRPSHGHTHSRSTSLSQPGGVRARKTSTSAQQQQQIESAISQIQAKHESKASGDGATYLPGVGGFVGGPPTATASAVSSAVTRKHSVRHRRDPTRYSYNGRTVSTQERIVKDVTLPSSRKPTEPEFWSYKDPLSPVPNLEFLKRHFAEEGRLTEEQAMYILDAGHKLFEREPNMIIVNDGTTVCGDIHGQYYDLLKLFEVGGDPCETPYLFLGDYVDRGSFGIECVLYLYALKLHYPTTFFLLRGNHECRHLTSYFTFKRECEFKYSTRVYEASLRSFRALPIAALLDGRFLCVHGGIGPDMITLEDIASVDRFQETPMSGTLCDILWADPIETYNKKPEPDYPRARRADTPGSHDRGAYLPPGFLHNKVRGCSYLYTYTAVSNFLRRNNLLSVIRAHEAQDAGYQMYRTGEMAFPSLITIFSAPNYLDAYANKAAVLKFVGGHFTIRQFNMSGHPYWLPGFMDGFTWSLPFVGQKIADMLLAILNCCTEEELVLTDEDEEMDELGDEFEETTEASAHRSEAIKNKVLAVGRMARVFELLRDEAEGMSELVADEENEAPPRHRSSKLGVEELTVNRSIRGFNDARRRDISNERLPSPTRTPKVLMNDGAPASTAEYPYTGPRMVRTANPGTAGTGVAPPGMPDRYVNPNRVREAYTPETEYSDDEVLYPATQAAEAAAASSYGQGQQGYADESYAYSRSLAPRRRSTTDMIRRQLEEPEEDVLRLAMRLSKPLVGKEVKRAYVGRERAGRSIRRTDTA